MPARRQEGVPAIPTAKERDFRQGCITPPVRGSIWRRCGSLWRCPPAFAAAFPVASSVCTSFNPDRPVAFLPVCPRAGRQAQGQAGMQAEGQGCQPDGRKACRPFRPQRKGTFAELMSLCPCVAAFGANVVACGVPQPLSDPDLPPTFAPKRQGNAPGAYRGPGSVLLLGSRRVSVARYLYGIVITGISPIRLLRIFVSSKTQQGVL